MRDQAPLLIVLAFVATATGLLLRFNEADLFDRPWLLSLVPVVNALGGNLGAILGARVTSALHLGVIEPRFTRGGVSKDGGLMLAVGASVYMLLAVAIVLVGPQTGLFPQASLGRVALLVLSSGLILTLGVIGLSLGAALAAYRRGLDPDDIVIPIVTNAADLLGVVVLFAISGVVL